MPIQSTPFVPPGRTTNTTVNRNTRPSGSFSPYPHVEYHGGTNSTALLQTTTGDLSWLPNTSYSTFQTAMMMLDPDNIDLADLT